MPLIGKLREQDENMLPVYGSSVAAAAVPRVEMPDHPMRPAMAKQLIMDVC